MEDLKFTSGEFHQNRWTAIGRLSCDAEPASNGKPYVWVKIYVNTQEPGRDGKPGGWKEQQIRCQRWRPSEDFLKWATKNRRVYVEGRLEGWHDDNGRIQMVVNLDVFRYLDPPNHSQNGKVSHATHTAGEMAEMTERNQRLTDLNGELKSKMDELTTANEEWLREYSAVQGQVGQLQKELDSLKAQAVKPSPVKPGRAPAKRKPAGKGKNR